MLDGARQSMRVQTMNAFVITRGGRAVMPKLILLVLVVSLDGGGIRAVEAAAPSGAPSLTRGVELFDKRNFKQAAVEFQNALSRNANDVEALFYLGRLAFQENQLDEAKAFLEKACAVDPHNSEAFHWLGRVYGVQAKELGIPRGFGPARRTGKALEKAVALDPDNLKARLELADFYRKAPLIVGGGKRASVAQVNEIARRDAYLGLLAQGDLAFDESRFADARRDYERAVKLAARRGEAHFRLGLLHLELGEYSQASASFEKTLELDPEEKRALYQIGKTADLSGQGLDRGEEALKAYLACKPYFIMPKLARAHYRLGNIYAKKGQRAAARQQYLAAVKTDDKEAARALRQLDHGGNDSRP